MRNFNTLIIPKTTASSVPSSVEEILEQKSVDSLFVHRESRKEWFLSFSRPTLEYLVEGSCQRADIREKTLHELAQLLADSNFDTDRSWVRNLLAADEKTSKKK
jgi:hypothetical protein